MAFLKRFVLALTFLAFQCSTWCQGDTFCGAEESHVLLMGLDPSYSGGFASLNDHLAATAGMPRNNLEVYTIPVVVHVIHRGSPLGVDENITDAQILSAIEGLNNDFRKRPGTLGDGEGVDTFIEFKLAQRTPEGEPTNGILRVNGNSVPGYAEHGISNGLDSDAADQTALKGLTTWYGDDYINIFVVPEINGNDGGNGIQGFAYLGPTNDARDGIVILYNAFGLEGELKPGRTLNKTITHEMGHHLSLYHTFSNTSTCTSETNCETQGDLVCDTPATLANDSGCDSPECAGALVENYMDYTLETCKNMFTAGQRDRMRGALESARSSLLESLGGMAVTERDLTVAGLANVGESTCIPSLAPVVVVTNFGTETVTGFELTTSVNGLTPFTTVHQESVASGASVQVMLPELALAAGTNELSLEVRLLGNVQDDFAGNDQSVQTILLEPGDYWTMTLNTDTWGNEISWRIEDLDGEALMSGGGYPINAATYVSSGCVPVGCHTLIMEDSNGDGLCSIDFGDDGICEIGGSMTLTNAADDVLVELDNTNNNYGSQGSWEVCASEVTEMEGCADENSNGICDVAEILGCPDVNACNFTPGAIFDDGSCTYAEQYYDCNGQCHCDEDGDGVCCELEVSGCTNPMAINFDPDATEDNDVCVVLDGNCVIGSGAFASLGGLTAFSSDDAPLTVGLNANVNFLLALPETVTEPETGGVYHALSFELQGLEGLPLGLNYAYSQSTTESNGALCLNVGGVPEETGLYELVFHGQLTVSVFGQELSIEEVSTSSYLEVVPNPNPIWGCTYAFASNYLSFASMDDGSCIIAGCTDPEACNHQALAELDDDSCDYSCWGCTYEAALNFDSDVTRDDGSCVFDWAESTCPEDLDNDGLVGSADLLSVLGQFGLSCESP